ncbi:GreA/GreB family elongation factor [Rubrivirga sp. IMCC45206]|uniref:GreA/GreB family elongation factor n=1 Tax=Rubrivirga sp. IMCC45206 TaxID=3391614 RepID=UPI0039902B33
MSRAFVKEGAPEVPVVVPPRPPLPAGVPNYVTPAGLAALRAERAEVERQRAEIDAEDPDAGRTRETLTGRLKLLVERIARSQVVDPAASDRDDVRFGATVTVREADGSERTVQIVGVDQAASGGDTVAFTSPFARALTGMRVGDTATLTTPSGDRELSVVAVRYG